VSKVVTIEADSSRFTSSPYLPAGLKKLGKYKLVYRFATGGMANLYLGKFAGPDGFEKLVAIKIIHDHLTSNPDFIKMFVDEARLVSRISHPNVAQIIELGRVGRTYFIAMEYVEGESVGAILRRTCPPVGVGCRIVADAAAGLHAAHELRSAEGDLFNVVHRDVSPQNILVAYGGATKVVDFGVAQARGMLHTTKDGALRGKFGYMAPEQAQSRPVDRRADIYVLGIVLYELTTRRKLFKAESDSETLRKVLENEVTPPTRLVKAYPPALEQIVLRALQPVPEHRYQTARQMQEAIEKFIVSHGDPVLPAHVGELMADIFKDRIEKKKRIQRSVNDNTTQSLPIVSFEDVPDADLTRSSTTWLTRLTDTPKRRAVAVAAAVGLLGVVVLLVVWLASGGEEDASATAARTGGRAATTAADLKRATKPGERPSTPAPVKRITIQVKVTPAEATITFDGRKVKNPYRHRGVAADREVLVIAAAPHRAPKRFKVSLAKDSQWMIELSPQSKKQPHRRRRRNKRLTDDDVLDNPYR
jgi:serine/threonine-protein kinase